MARFVDMSLLVSVIFNLWTVYRLHKKYNLRQCLYFIQCLDAGLTLVASVDLLAVSLICRHMDTSNGLLCCLMFFGNAIVPVTFPVFNLSSAYIRWENIIRSLSGKRWRPNRQFNMSIAILTAGCIFYTFILVFGNWLGDADMSALYSICMNTNQASRTYLLGIGIGIPGLVSILVTMGIDWKCYQTVKTFRRGQNEAERTKPTVRTHKNADFLRFLGQEAPMRSTIINVVCIFFSVTIGSLVICMEENLQDDMDKVLIPIALFYALKSPVNLVWSTRVSYSNLMEIEAKERSQRLDWERDQARNTRFWISQKKYQNWTKNRKRFDDATERFQRECNVDLDAVIACDNDCNPPNSPKPIEEVQIHIHKATVHYHRHEDCENEKRETAKVIHESNFLCNRPEVIRFHNTMARFQREFGIDLGLDLTPEISFNEALLQLPFWGISIAEVYE